MDLLRVRGRRRLAGGRAGRVRMGSGREEYGQENGSTETMSDRQKAFSHGKATAHTFITADRIFTQ